jgi:hypothetical protein
MTLQCMKLTAHITLNFNNIISVATVFLNIEKAIDTTWHLGLLYKLSNLKFSVSLIKLIRYFLSQRNFRVAAKSEMSTPRDIQAGVPQGSVLSPTLYIIYINDTPQNTWCLRLFADDICMYATDFKVGYVLRKLQRGLHAIGSWCECGNIKINEIRLRPSTFLINLSPCRLISLFQWMEYPLCQSCKLSWCNLR